MVILIIIVAIGVCLGLLLFGGVLFAAVASVAVPFVTFIFIPVLLAAGIIWLIRSVSVTAAGRSSRLLLGPNLRSVPPSDKTVLAWMAILVVGGVLLLLLINFPSKQRTGRDSDVVQQEHPSASPASKPASETQLTSSIPNNGSSLERDISATTRITKAESKDVYGNTPLINAVIDNNTTVVRRLLAQGADANGRGSGGRTPLMFAADGGHTGLLKLLLARGADVNARSDVGQTALIMSIYPERANKELVRVLLAAGADVNARMKGGLTPLIQAVLCSDEATVKTLLTKGADVSMRMEPSDTFLSGWAASDFANWKGQTAIVRLLSDYDAKSKNVSIKTTPGIPSPDAAASHMSVGLAPLSSETPELLLENVLLAPRRKLDAILGHPRADDVGDCDIGDHGFSYKDASYVCVHKGNVVLLSYSLKRKVTSPSEALAAVGLKEQAMPVPLIPNRLYVWTSERGNALGIRGKQIPDVTLIIPIPEVEKPATLHVTMMGWETLR